MLSRNVVLCVFLGSREFCFLFLLLLCHHGAFLIAPPLLLICSCRVCMSIPHIIGMRLSLHSIDISNNRPVVVMANCMIFISIQTLERKTNIIIYFFQHCMVNRIRPDVVSELPRKNSTTIYVFNGMADTIESTYAMF